jgi:hypothetical protein
MSCNKHWMAQELLEKREKVIEMAVYDKEIKRWGI